MSNIIKLGEVQLELYDHRDIDLIDDDFQAVIVTPIQVNDSNIESEAFIQDFYNEKSEYKRDAFYHSNDTGCRDIPLMR